MIKSGFKLAANIALIFLFGIIQSFSLISFNGIKPDIVMSFLIVLLFSARNFWEYLFMVMTAAISLGYSYPITKEIAIFCLIMISAYLLRKYVSSREFLSVTLVTALLTFIFYLAIDYHFIFEHFNYFSLEMIFNVLASIIIWLIYPHEYEK